MAQLESKGIEELAKQLKELQLSTDKKLIKDMLTAGGRPVIRSWQTNMTKVIMPRGTVKTYVHIRRGKISHYQAKSRTTGQTADAVNGNIKLLKAAVGANDIYPKGQTTGRKKNVRYAEIAFILHYGKGGQPPTNFVDTAVDGSEDECLKEMDKVFEEYLRKHNLI